MIRAKVTVSLKQDVMDPQGNAVGQALHTLGHDNVRRVRVGRSFDLLLEGDDVEKSRAQVKEMCEALLANTVIERYEIELEAVSATVPAGVTAA
ncbi:MAG: phosphoribosylformylglycinamidine synthase subunit PurS [Candidatus Sumerlaeaceae bacterium]